MALPVLTKALSLSSFSLSLCLCVFVNENLRLAFQTLERTWAQKDGGDAKYAGVFSHVEQPHHDRAAGAPGQGGRLDDRQEHQQAARHPPRDQEQQEPPRQRHWHHHPPGHHEVSGCRLALSFLSKDALALALGGRRQQKPRKRIDNKRRGSIAKNEICNSY